MKLKKIRINNFRCFGPSWTEVDFEELTAIIGSNSSGKTALMSALLKLFGETSSEKEITRADFHIKGNSTNNDIKTNYFKAEAVFSFPEVENDGDKTYAIPLYFESLVVNKPGDPPCLRILLEATWMDADTPAGIVESKIFCITVPEESDITDSDKKFISKQDLSRIKVIYVPALRNPVVQLRNASGTLLWRVLKGIKWSDELKKEISDKVDAVNSTLAEQDGISIIKESITTQWGKYHQDHRYNQADIKFNNTDLDTMLKRVEVEFFPTETSLAYSVEDLGDGLRSLFYISLVSSLLDIEDKSASYEKVAGKEPVFNLYPPALTIVAVEEPENHIAPHLLGKVIANLREISTRPNSQTIISSHAPSLIKRIDPLEIRYFRICKDELCTITNKISLPEADDEAYKYVKEAVKAYPELYFSRLVILGEGDSEEIIISKVLETLGPSVDSSGISVVPLGGRHVNHFWRLLKQLDIPHITLLDLDRERSGGGWGRIKYVLQELLDFGYDKQNLLTSLTEKKLKNMHTWDVKETAVLDAWVGHLKKYNVFFSHPLDIDFMMLEAYSDVYLDTIEGREGPYIAELGKITKLTELQKQSKLYEERLKDDIKATLKAQGTDGSTYTSEQKELMIWYTYFFLSRGKPTTHLSMLSKIFEDDFKKRLPKVLTELQERAIEILRNDPYSACGGGDILD